jgi:ketosteroid isomerase-like protein
MRTCILLSFIFYYSISYAQNVEEVIQAEKDFAAYARVNNTRDAFLNFLDSNAVIFNKGQTLNAKKVFSGGKPSTSKLLWQPAFAGIALSGDVGFTTGPFEIRTSLTDTVSSAGAYSTIWHKMPDGQWKFLVDLGIEQGQLPMQFENIHKVPPGNPSNYYKKSEAKMLDSLFIVAYKRDARKAFIDNLHDQACINMKGTILQQGKENWAAIIKGIPTKLEMQPIDAGTSKAGDLIWVYGSVKYEGKNENYLRVWQNTVKGFKIVLQTLIW